MSRPRFEDRLLEFLVEEISTPALPASEDRAEADRAIECPITSQPARHRAASRVWRVAAGAAAVIALAVGGIVAAWGDSGTVVSGPPSSAYPYLTFGQPTDTVFRNNSLVVDPSTRRFTLRDPAARDIVIEVRHGLNDRVHATEPAGSIAGRPTFRNNSLMGMPATYQFADGDDVWTVQGGPAVAGEVDVAYVESEIETFLSELNVDIGELAVGPQYQELPVWEHSYPAWLITTIINEGQAMTLTAFQDATTEIDDLPGTLTTVRGNSAVIGRLGLTWRETPESILILSVNDDFMAEIPNVEAWQRTRLRAAEVLVDSDRAEYRALPGIEDYPVAGPVGIIVTASSDAGPIWASFSYLGGSIGASYVQSLPVGSEGASIDRLDGTTGVLLWTGEPTGPTFLDGTAPPPESAPTCATRVDFPAPNSPPTRVELDLGCTNPGS